MTNEERLAALQKELEKAKQRVAEIQAEIDALNNEQ
jgi:predicted  nucleic acid-binding Zn-ribbon protein